MRRYYTYLWIALTTLCLIDIVSTASATPYASCLSVSGTTVNFILNEPADTLTYSLNGGAPVALNGATKGAKTFNLGSASDKFSIFAEKNAAQGFTILNGSVEPTNVNANSLPTNQAYGVI